MGSSLKNGVLLAIICLFFIGVGAGGGLMLFRYLQPANQPFLTALGTATLVPIVLPSTTPRPTFTPAAIAAAPDTTILQVSSATPEPTATISATATVVASPTPLQVLFRVIAPQVQFYAGPGTAYAAIAAAQQGAILPVVSRTPNGIWWEVCCLQGQTVWLMLDGKTVLEQGDVNLVTLSPATIYDATPTPSAVPAPPTPIAPPFSAAPPPPLAMRTEPTPAPTPTYEPANPACAIPGATYGTQTVMGESDRRPAALNPEYNLALRSYTLVDGFRQMVGIGGETDRHAPQLNTMFADRRIENDFPAVYQVHDWSYDCNCRRGQITTPEVTALGVSSRPGELLHTPDRTEGDIGGGYRALVLYASPTSLTLKYTREDNMLYGYAIHLDGICVDPTLLEFYRELDRAGRQTLPALNGGQPIGYTIGGEIRVAVRDTGQFMDPRSQKDWWAGE